MTSNKGLSSLSDFVRERMAVAGMTQAKQLALKAGITEQTVGRILNGDMGRLQMRTAQKLAEALDCSIMDVADRAEQEHKPLKKAKKEKSRPETKPDQANDEEKRSKQDGTLCWECRHAVPSRNRGCLWSSVSEPVPGWMAIPTVINGCCSFRVLKCPNFEPEPEGPRARLDPDEIPQKAAENLANAIALTAAKDYREGCKEEAKRLNAHNKKARALAAFYPGTDPDDKHWRDNPRPEPWYRWMLDRYKCVLPGGVILGERFFTSGYGRAICQADPMVIVQGIRKECGLPEYRIRMEDEE